MKRLITLTTISALSLFIYGCGGSSDGDDETPPSLDGIYSGSITGGDTALNGDEKAIIYNNRLMMISLPGGIQQLINAPLTLDSTNISSTTAGVYAGPGTVPNSTLNINGSFTENSTLNATFQATSGNTTTYMNGSIELTSNIDTFNQSASSNLISGNWRGPLGFGETRFTFNANGNISGDDDEGCNFSGRYTIPDNSINVYEISIDSVGGCTPMPEGTYTGYAWIEFGNSNSLIFIVSSKNGSRGTVLTK